MCFLLFCLHLVAAVPEHNKAGPTALILAHRVSALCLVGCREARRSVCFVFVVLPLPVALLLFHASRRGRSIADARLILMNFMFLMVSISLLHSQPFIGVLPLHYIRRNFWAKSNKEM